VHFPEQRFSVVVLLNFSPANSYRAAYDVVDIYLADRLKPLQDVNTRKKPALEPVDVPITMLDEYVGTYKLGAAWYVTITRDGNRLMTQATAETVFPMTPQSESTFWVKDYGASILFKRDDKNRITHFRYRGMTCPKVEDIPAPSPEQLDELTGEYKSEELQTYYTVSLEENKVKIKHRRHGSISLTPAWKDDFRGGVWFMRSVNFCRTEEGEVAGFVVTQSRSRNQRFIKQ
jgi:hypothetical protein